MGLVLVDSGRGNLRSVEKALVAAGGEPVRTSDPDVVRRADRVVVPGQGAFADAMAAMTTSGLDEALRELVATGTPYLGICLGLQLLFESSDEHGVTPGLGIVAGKVVRLEGGPGLKIPHIGWNDVTSARPDPVLAPEGQHDRHYYFVHSYAAVPADPSLEVLRCDYGGPVCAGIRADNVVAVQFHPEKSQRAGIALLRRFLETT